MKAIVYKKNGSPDVLELKKVEKPIPQEYENFMPNKNDMNNIKGER